MTLQDNNGTQLVRVHHADPNNRQRYTLTMRECYRLAVFCLEHRWVRFDAEGRWKFGVHFEWAAEQCNAAQLVPGKPIAVHCFAKAMRVYVEVCDLAQVQPVLAPDIEQIAKLEGICGRLERECNNLMAERDAMHHANEKLREQLAAVTKEMLEGRKRWADALPNIRALRDKCIELGRVASTFRE